MSTALLRSESFSNFHASSITEQRLDFGTHDVFSNDYLSLGTASLLNHFRNDAYMSALLAEQEMCGLSMLLSHRTWMARIEKKLDELVELPIGWDGYLGKPVSPQVARYAAQMLNEIFYTNIPAPSLVPGSDGSLQIEWHINSYDLEIEILSPRDVIATRYNIVTGQEGSINISSDFTELSNWVKALSNKSTSS